MRRGVDLHPVRALAQEDVRRTEMLGEAEVTVATVVSTVRGSATTILFMMRKATRMTEASHRQRPS